MTVSAVCCACTRRVDYFLINRLFRFARLMALADYHRQQSAAVSNRILQTFDGFDLQPKWLNTQSSRMQMDCDIYIPPIEWYTHLSYTYIYFIWWWKSHITRAYTEHRTHTAYNMHCILTMDCTVSVFATLHTRNNNIFFLRSLLCTKHNATLNKLGPGKVVVPLQKAQHESASNV